MWLCLARWEYCYRSVRYFQMMEDLVPTVIPEPVSSLPVPVDGCDPRCTKRAYTHRGVHNPLLVLRRERFLHDLL